MTPFHINTSPVQPYSFQQLTFSSRCHPQSQSRGPRGVRWSQPTDSQGLRAELIETTKNNHQCEAPPIQANGAILADKDFQYEDKKTTLHESEMILIFSPLFLMLFGESPSWGVEIASHTFFCFGCLSAACIQKSRGHI